MGIFKDVFNLNDGDTFYVLAEDNKDISLILNGGEVCYYHKANTNPVGKPVEIDVLYYILNHPESVFTGFLVTNDIYNIINALAIIYPTAEYIERVDDNTLIVSNNTDGAIEDLPHTLNNMFKCIKKGRPIKIKEILKHVNDYKTRQTQTTTTTTYATQLNIPEACKGCPNHPSNGGSGICNCTLGGTTIYCSIL